MGVGEPLCGGGSHSGNDGGEGAEGAAAYDQPPVTESIFDAFHDAAQFFHFLGCDARPKDRQLNGFRNRVESNCNRNKPNSVPEKELVESIALNTGDRIETDGCKHQANTAGDHALQYVLAAKGCDKGNTEY